MFPGSFNLHFQTGEPRKLAYHIIHTIQGVCHFVASFRLPFWFSHDSGHLGHLRLGPISAGRQEDDQTGDKDQETWACLIGHEPNIIQT